MAVRTERRYVFAAIALIAVHAALLVICATHNSITFDEYAHLPAGCTYAKYGGFWIDNHNPPLERMLVGLPVLLAHPFLPDPIGYRDDQPQVRGWSYAHAFELMNPRYYREFFLIGRLAIIPVSCIGAWLVFVWARALYGSLAGLAACAVWAFEPTIIANGSVVATDMGAAVSMLAGLWAWQRFCTKPSTGRAFVAAILVTVAHCTKFTAMLLWPAMIVILLMTQWRDRRLRLSERIVGLIITIIFTFAGLNLCYGYRHSFEKLRDFPFQTQSMQRIARTFPNLRAPFPRDMLLGIDVAKWEVDNGHPGYLLGKSYNGGRWYFYPVALAVKLPISVLILLTLTFGSMFFRRPSFGEIILLVSLVLILVGWMPSGSNMNVGIRYLLPLYPLAIILVARLWTFGKALRLFGSLLLLGLLIESFSICPRYFTFFNAFAHGRGWTIVNDSDFDWGQGLIDLKKWQDQTHAGKIELAYFGMVNPSDYGIEWRPFGHGDDEEYVGISSCFVVGMRHRVRTEDGTHWLHLPYYKALLKLEPIAKPGGTIFIYRREDFEKARGAK